MIRNTASERNTMDVQKISLNEFFNITALKDDYHNFTFEEHFVTRLNWMKVNTIPSEKISPNTLEFKKSYPERIFSFVSFYKLVKDAVR